MTDTSTPRLLCLVQLPPPVHGASTISKLFVESSAINSRYALDVVPLRFSSSIAELERPSVAKIGRAAVSGLRLLAALLRRRPDAVYFTLTPRGGGFYRDCVYVAMVKLFGVPRIYHLHGKGIADQLATRWKRRLYSWAFQGANVIALSPLLEVDFAGLVPTNRVRYVGNGVPDLELTGEVPSRRADEDRPIRILYLSNMVEEKGPLILLEAVGLVKERGIAFEATFAGAPHGDCLATFHARVRQLKLSKEVRYVGPAYDDDKRRLLATHDIFALPSLREAFPLVILEAMQFGLPVVSTTEGAIPEIVVDGETGFLVPRRAAGPLADRLTQLAMDRELRERMGTHGRFRYLAHYTARHFERSMLDALDHLTKVR